MSLKSTAHLKLDTLTERQYSLIYNEFKRWKTFYPLKLPEIFSLQTRKIHYEAVANLALRGVKGNITIPFYLPGTKKNTEIKNTELWNVSPHTTAWLIHKFGPLENIGGVTYQRLSSGKQTSWHTHYIDKNANYDWCILHLPLVSNVGDICEVKIGSGIESQRYNNGELWLFNSWEEHRSCNTGRDRFHLVFEIYSKKIDEIIFRKKSVLSKG